MPQCLLFDLEEASEEDRVTNEESAPDGSIPESVCEGATEALASNSGGTEDSPAVSSPYQFNFEDFTEDEKLYYCFLYSMKKKINSAQLPMLTSAFFRDCIQVCW